MVEEAIDLVTLSNLAEGALEELFQDSFQKVLDNIEDPNTDEKAKREIIMRVTVTPDGDRRHAKVSVGCTTKVCGVQAVKARLLIGKHLGRMVAREAERQEEMFPTPQGKPEVVATTA